MSVTSLINTNPQVDCQDHWRMCCEQYHVNSKLEKCIDWMLYAVVSHNSDIPTNHPLPPIRPLCNYTQ